MGSKESDVDISQVYTTEGGYWKGLWVDEPSRDWSEFRHVLEAWSGISNEEALEHTRAVRNKAYEVFPWPCLALFSFPTFCVSSHPFSSKLLHRLREKDEKFLDAGCCFGQELRKLAVDGVPTKNLSGTDLHRQFMDYGYELFNDRNKIEATFVAGDILTDDWEGSEVSQLDGKMDIVQAANFLHVFNWDDQAKALSRMVGFLKPDAEDAVIYGAQLGAWKAGLYIKSDEADLSQGRFRHDVQTFNKLFDEVAEKTGTKWKVEASMRAMPERALKASKKLDDLTIFIFEAHRLKCSSGRPMLNSAQYKALT